MTASLTSIRAFHETVSEREAQTQRLLGLYLSSGPMSDRKASYITGWERGTVSARRNDLIKLGRVCELGKERDEDTGKTVTVWGVIRETLFD